MFGAPIIGTIGQWCTEIFDIKYKKSKGQYTNFCKIDIELALTSAYSSTDNTVISRKPLFNMFNICQARKSVDRNQ